MLVVSKTFGAHTRVISNSTSMKPLLIILFNFIGLGAFAQSYHYEQPETLNDGWESNNIRLLMKDTTILNQLFGQLYQGPNKLHSVLLVNNGKLVLEEYFNGASIDQPHDLRSATKSIRSLLLGIAMEKGFIGSIDDSIFKYLEQRPTKNLDNRKEEITIRHLLTMSSGLDCNDWDKKSAGQEDKIYKKKDWVQYTLDLPMINDPGEISTYCSMGVVLLAEIIEQASGMSIDKFADKYLFEPLRITNYTWGHTSNKEVISAGRRLYLTTRDFAKIGQLVLDKGKLNGKQIVSSEWVQLSTTASAEITGMEYGFLWWNIPFTDGENNITSVVATGNGGQYLMIYPTLNLLAVFTGGAYNSEEDKLPFMIMNKALLPNLNY